MSKKYYWHIVWILYLVYIFLEGNILSNWEPRLVILTSTFVFNGLITFYLFYFFVWLPFFKNRNKLELIFRIILGLSFYIAFRFLVEEVLCPKIFGFGNYYSLSFWYYVNDNIWRAGFYGLTSLVIVFAENYYALERNVLATQNEQQKAELSLLRSQLNPHFLFNTLNFLYTKSVKLDPQLSTSIQQFSEVLRYSVDHSEETRVTVQKEIDILQSYVDIFRKRFDGACFVHFEVTGKALHQELEPFLFIPFVENMFKHGIINDSNSPAQIKLDATDQTLTFHCQNRKNQLHKDPGSGIGIENVQRRLQLLYPNKHQLEINDQGDVFEIALTLNLN